MIRTEKEHGDVEKRAKDDQITHMNKTWTKLLLLLFQKQESGMIHKQRGAMAAIEWRDQRRRRWCDSVTAEHRTLQPAVNLLSLNITMVLQLLSCSHGES